MSGDGEPYAEDDEPKPKRGTLGRVNAPHSAAD